MARYLMTQSLLASWGYMFSCWEEGQEQAKEDFIRTLNRELTPVSEAMADGNAFETEVYAAAQGRQRAPHPKWENGIQTVASVIKGAPSQVRVQREIEVLGYTFLLYGVLDALQAGVIFDVKYKSKSFGSLDLAGSYLESPQHPAYLYLVPEAYEFQYLVSDGVDLYKEVYTRENTRSIGDIIAEFITSIEAMGLLGTYLDKWVAK